MTDIRDIKGLVPLPGWPWWAWLVLGLAILALLAAGAWWWRRRSGSASTIVDPPTVMLSADEEARRALAELRKEQVIERGEVERFYARVSAIVRRYLERRFQLRAPEQTTEEFLRDAARDDRLDAGQRDLLARFLEECDLVKFARLRPGQDEMERALGAAEGFVEQTREQSIAEVAEAAEYG